MGPVMGEGTTQVVRSSGTLERLTCAIVQYTFGSLFNAACSESPRCATSSRVSFTIGWPRQGTALLISYVTSTGRRETFMSSADAPSKTFLMARRG